MIKSKNQKNKSGFTLIEALMAIVVLTIGILGVIQLFPAGLNSAKLSKEETIATNLVQAKLEEDKANSYDNVISEARAKVSTNPSDQNYNYERISDITYLNSDMTQSTNDTGLKKIIVTVYWQQNNISKNVNATLLKNKD
jgi:prepilin-type N-terminal cleavage/methylation domain-containing protein